MSPQAVRGGDAQAEIFAATERLLERVPVHDLSVAQIIEEAGLSRATFYFYFRSKYDVIVGLLRRITDELYEIARPFLERPDDEPPETALERGSAAAAKLWGTHRLAMRAVSEYWHAVPELREMWLEILERFKDALGAEIDRQRRAGLAPPGIDSRQLVAALFWGAERCFYVAGLGVEDALASEEQAGEALYQVWHGAIYGNVPVAASKKPARRRRAS